MLTGDKGETAQTIGNSCGIIDDQKQDVLKIGGVKKEQLEKEVDHVFEIMKAKGLDRKSSMKNDE